MARKKEKTETGYVLFNVEYEDGTRSSNRRVAKAILGGMDADAQVKQAIEEQDQTIAERSGQPRGPVKKIRRSPT